MNYIKFSYTYNVAKLCAELEAVLQEEWPLHFNTRDFNGDWRSISLRSVSGASKDIYAHANGAYSDTPVLTRMPYVKEILDAWQCEKEAVRLLSLAPGSVIKPHRDPGCSYDDGHFRIHIPIITNPQVQFILEDEQLPLKAGECWYMNFSATHSIINNGSSARIHLVIDGIRNSWTDELFTAHGYRLTDKHAVENLDATTRTRMIEELEKMDTAASRELVARLKAAQ
ncbi:aspartyl/asparaginyl beta-hydroxylase domain-containing protein [uncultured Chitinophaga sp.]|jgi:Uncharacterized conserved protein, contains double-stranded beta-helix domain|uniref:aspartyl/asparaginyl beta-hydroxylase domain-containing protein n=1 Tax=uncultured Chitinophaga sp. TaxID=339340 RepID=UPI00261F4A49|nr:aspartyl/asparaginyl beta-hydroxylase domain-containing protein [uncultured Chitinophaga sp.]